MSGGIKNKMGAKNNLAGEGGKHFVPLRNELSQRMIKDLPFEFIFIQSYYDCITQTGLS